MTTLLKEHMALPPTRQYHWTAERFYRAARAGAFDDPGQLELVHGRIIEKMPQSPLHRACRVRVGNGLRRHLPEGLVAVDECPISIAFDGEPVPDLVVLIDVEADDAERHPSPVEVALLVEVAVTSEEYDLGDKALLYAQAGIGDYWVVLPEIGEIVVHRDPTPEGYQSVARAGADSAVSPLAAPEATLTVRELLGG